MERDIILYKCRRKFQVIAHKLFSNEAMSKFYYRIVLNKSLNLENPKTFNEKLQWYKLYYCPTNPLVIQCADKYCVRSFIESKGLKKYLTNLFGDWDDARKIEWDKLPNRFVLKCNHGCAYNILCSNKKELDIKHTTEQLNKWIKEDFGAYNIEIHYSKIQPHKIICEEYLGDVITDYKFYCFNGVPQFFYISNDLIHDRQAKIGFFNIDGSKLPLVRNDYENINEVDLPEYFEEMLNVAKNICEDFPFVRVDFFVTKNRFYFAELTFTPAAAMMPINPEKYDLEWGKLLDLSFDERK